MFAEAYDRAHGYTLPFVCLYQQEDGVGLWQFPMIVLNEDGWFLTAQHCLEKVQATLEEARGVVYAGGPGSELSRDGYNPEGLDLHVGRIAGFDADWIDGVARLRRPEDRARLGALLCAFGLRDFDEGAFQVDGDWAVPRPGDPPASYQIFSVAGTISWAGNLASGPGQALELSTRVIPSHSGGPLVDWLGTVCGMVYEGQEREAGVTGGDEHALWTGTALQTSTIADVLVEMGVDFRWEPARRKLWRVLWMG